MTMRVAIFDGQPSSRHDGVVMRIVSGVALVYIAALLACGHKSEVTGTTRSSPAGTPIALMPQGRVLEAAENEGPSAIALPRTTSTPQGPAFAAGARAEIPSGKLTSGSTPGDKGRDPSLEPALVDVELGGYAIDRYLYPNDPARPALTGITRVRAAELCQQVGGRLCTELEWERACKGPEATAYAGSVTWDATCAKVPETCASGFGVLGMGAALREWTASDVALSENQQQRVAAVRGARGEASPPDHRCAHRMAVDSGIGSDDLGFRCCYGPPNAVSIAAPIFQQTFRKAELTPAQVAEMFTGVPQLKELGHELSFYKDPDDTNLVLSRGDAGPGNVPNTSFTTAPLLWSPVPGEEILVVAGRAQKSSFIVAFYRLPGDRYRIGSSFILENEKGPIAFGTNNYVRKRLSWALCWDCRGESGYITYRDDNRVVITQK